MMLPLLRQATVRRKNKASSSMNSREVQHEVCSGDRAHTWELTQTNHRKDGDICQWGRHAVRVDG
jgi:hypothetical protein